jgi:hypothetical protein
VVGIVTRLRAGRPGVRIARRATDNVQAHSGAHLASYSMGIGGKSPGREFDRSPPPSVEVKNKRAIPLLPVYIMARTGATLF